MVHTDSAVTKAILNKGRSKNAFINDVLRAVCWKSVTIDFEVRVIHVPGSLTGIPDAISRLHETGQPGRLARLLSYWHHGCSPPAPIAAHMSRPSYHFMCQQTNLHIPQEILLSLLHRAVCAAGTAIENSYSYVCCLFS